VSAVAANAELQPASNLTAASTELAQPEPARKSPARKKSEQTASRLRDPPVQYLTTPAQFDRAAAQAGVRTHWPSTCVSLHRSPPTSMIQRLRMLKRCEQHRLCRRRQHKNKADSE
jgi:hypothetical protein